MVTINPTNGQLVLIGRITIMEHACYCMKNVLFNDTLPRKRFQHVITVSIRRFAATNVFNDLKHPS